jgi:hypothetical protein
VSQSKCVGDSLIGRYDGERHGFERLNFDPPRLDVAAVLAPLDATGRSDRRRMRRRTLRRSEFDRGTGRIVLVTAAVVIVMIVGPSDNRGLLAVALGAM